MASSKEAEKILADIRANLAAVEALSGAMTAQVVGVTEAEKDMQTITAAVGELAKAIEKHFQSAAGAPLPQPVRHDLVTQLSIIIDTLRLLSRKTPAEASWRKDLDRLHTAALAIFDAVDSFDGDRKIARSMQGYNEPVRSADPNILPPYLASARVLVVDDALTSLMLMRRQLELLGCEVTTANTGTEALTLLTRDPFDVAIFDLSMPDLDGDELLQRVRKHPKLRHLPVIMTSASDDFEAVVRCIQRGAEDFLPKPVNPVLLRARLCSALQRKHTFDLENEYRLRLQREKARVEELLHAILPAQAVRELQASQRVQPRHHDRVAVLFCDVCNFTSFSERHKPEEILEYLQELYENFEGSCERFGLEKIKTIGDSFMAVAGLENSLHSPVIRAIHCAQEMIATAPTLSARWNVRAAINVGPVVSGVVGRAKFAYDVWGDTVNVAARIESQAREGEVWISQSAVEEIEEELDAFPCGFIDLKGKGSTPLYRMEKGAREKRPS